MSDTAAALERAIDEARDFGYEGYGWDAITENVRAAIVAYGDACAQEAEARVRMELAGDIARAASIRSRADLRAAGVNPVYRDFATGGVVEELPDGTVRPYVGETGGLVTAPIPTKPRPVCPECGHTLHRDDDDPYARCTAVNCKRYDILVWAEGYDWSAENLKPRPVCPSCGSRLIPMHMWPGRCRCSSGGDCQNNRLYPVGDYDWTAEATP